jgi:uncharacterized integral membrane protein
MSGSVDYAFPAVDSITTQELARSPATAANAATIMNTIQNAELNSLNTSFAVAEDSGQNVMAYGMVVSRNATLDNIAKQLTASNRKVGGGANDTFTRQGEINEWQAQNKMDTLFFLQVTFLFFVIMILLIMLNKYEVLSTWTMGTTVGILSLVVVGILWNRASYTSNSRDKRFWNRRYIGLADNGNLTASMNCATSS